MGKTIWEWTDCEDEKVWLETVTDDTLMLCGVPVLEEGDAVELACHLPKAQAHALIDALLAQCPEHLAAWSIRYLATHDDTDQD